ncbi:hypothetical protein [Roseibium sp. MMSF_3412]|uniref:hypothetical protein n=1 Tax=Roseibium sp. MMSF_3412 TaxID=3046712 RepID=UPI00273FF0A2|nr:hypothetical protein [Roseibium sp. MMSF_3412]
MEVTFAAAMAACGGWFRQKVLTRLDPVRDSPAPTETAEPFTRYYGPEEFLELREPYRDARHRLRAKIAKRRWKMKPAAIGWPRLAELDAVVSEARETRTEFAVFWNHERVKDDELHNLVTQEYAKLVRLVMDAEDARFEWLDQTAHWLDDIGALTLADINALEPEDWSGAVRQALHRQINGSPQVSQKNTLPEETVLAPGDRSFDPGLRYSA